MSQFLITIDEVEEKKNGCSIWGIGIVAFVILMALIEGGQGDKDSEPVKTVQPTTVETRSKGDNGINTNSYVSSDPKRVIDLEQEKPSSSFLNDNATPSISLDDLDRLKDAMKTEKTVASQERPEESIDTREEINDAIGLYYIAVAYIKEDDIESAKECLFKMEAVQSSLSGRSNKLDTKIESLRHRLKLD